MKNKEAVIGEIFYQVRGHRPLAVKPLQGGAVNAVYAVIQPDGQFVIRMRDGYRDVYCKEAWAMAQAAGAGVPVPKVYHVGEYEGTAYMIMEKIEGAVLSDLQDNQLERIRELGRLARLINSISVEGFGFHLDMLPHPHFRESWRDTMEWEQQFIFGSKVLIEMGALDRQQFKKAQEFLSPMADWQSDPYLTHSDISFANAIEATDGTIYLLDWTLAKGSPVPVFEIANFSTGATPQQTQAFIEGYGLSAEQYAELESDARRISLASVLRAAVWAAGEKHPDMPKFVRDVQNVIQSVSLTPDT